LANCGAPPRFVDERDGIGPGAANAESDPEPQHRHLVAGVCPGAESGEDGVDQDADSHRPRATDAVAEVAENATTDGGAEHQRGCESGEPVDSVDFGVTFSDQALHDGARCHGHQSQFEAIEEQAEKGGGEHRDACGLR